MGLGGIGPLQLLIVLALVLLIFGTKKLRNFGSDLGGAIKGFKKAMAEDDGEKKKQDQLTDGDDGATIDTTAEKVEDKQQ